ncbi:MAG: hypothetical protein IH793_11620 [Acidobacteria bacterium]|nr:hypothetical protein [Acidobacteriota bacterium]
MDEDSRALAYEKAGVDRDRIGLIERLDDRGSPDEHVQPEIFAADPTEENWARLRAVKSELQTALAHEGRLDDYGAPVKGPENG